MASLILQSCYPFISLGFFSGSYGNTINFKRAVAMLRLTWPLSFSCSLTFFEPQHPQLFKQVNPLQQKSSRMNKHSYNGVVFLIFFISAIMCKLNGDSIKPNYQTHFVCKIILPSTGPMFFTSCHPLHQSEPTPAQDLWQL